MAIAEKLKSPIVCRAQKWPPLLTEIILTKTRNNSVSAATEVVFIMLATQMHKRCQGSCGRYAALVAPCAKGADGFEMRGIRM